ncbi:acyltransferase [Croceibacter atlanticus]|uniref:acyltransferase n=1 Tax=Croceibacter atlanticus TaxID=313588 RepID=UPI002E144E16|nr:acyltransferase [Croceibacter atlanticus]
MTMLSLVNRLFDFYKKHKNPIKFYRNLGVQIGQNCRLVGSVNFGSEPYLIKIGDHVSITSSSFITHDGAVWIFRKDNPNIDLIKPITLGNNIFIGSDCTILPGVNIGDNVIVGANSLVNKSLESGYVYAGVPVKKIKSIDDYWLGIKKEINSTKNFSFEEKKSFYKEKYFK